MIFRETSLPGVFVVDVEPSVDERGSFARTWCLREFEEHGLRVQWVQSNISRNHHRGTLRGLHYQAPPHEESKLVRCIAGRLYDVMLDLRVQSPTYGQHVSVELSSANQRAVFIPGGVAHGFQTLEDATEVMYLMSAFYAPDYSRGVRWDDPQFSIAWPMEVNSISARDATYPDYDLA